MKISVYFIIILFLLYSCQKEKPKVVQDQQPKTETRKENINSGISELPVHIDSTSHLLFPINPTIQVEEGTSSSYSYGSKNYNVLYVSGDEISGIFSNIKFQHLEEASFNSLTTEEIRIKNIYFLREIFTTTKKQILVYTVIDKDTNQDKNINSFDLESLYISNIDGTGFQKLSADDQELLNWKVIPANNRLYFRTIADTSQDGKFNEDDSLRYHFIDLAAENWEVQEFNPL